MIPLLTIFLALVPAQARRPPESNNAQPVYFKFYQDNLGAEYLKRCSRRQRPPNDGDSCRRNAKACLWGGQTCPQETPGGAIQPSSRCTCLNFEWKCTPFDCPTMPSACPESDPSAMYPQPICSDDLTCVYEDQTCCGRSFAMRQ
jgi:hypothetical protein